MDEKIIKRRKKNRKNLLYTLIFSVVTFFTYSHYIKLNEIKEEKKTFVMGEIFSVNKSFLKREEFFYKNEEYLKKHSFLKKEWGQENKGVKFYGKSEDKEQKYNLASAYESSKSPTTN